MSDQESNEQRLAFWLPAAAVALTTAAVLFFSVWGWQTGRIEGSEQTAASETIIISETATATEMAASSPADAIWLQTPKTMMMPKSLLKMVL